MSRNPVRILILLALLVGCGMSAQAATWYVRADGSDSGCTGTSDAAYAGGSGQACAFATPQACADAMGDGDTCLIGAGSYTACPERVYAGMGPGGEEDREAILGISGLSGVTIKGGGSTAGVVTFAATEIASGDYCDYGVLVYESSNITVGGLGDFEGFVVDGDFDGDSGAGADDNSRANAFYTTAASINLNDSTGIRIYGMTVYGPVSRGGWTDTSEFGTVGGNEQSQPNSDWRGNVVYVRQTKYGAFFPGGSDCTIEDGGCGADNLNFSGNRVIYSRQGTTDAWRFIGFYTKACGDCVIDSNYFECGTADNPTSGTDQCIYLRANQRAHVSNNHVQHFGGGQAFYCHNNPDTSEGHRIYNNTFFGGGRACLWLESCDGGTEVRNNVCLSDTAAGERWQNFAQMGGFQGAMGYNAMHGLTNDPYFADSNSSPTCSDAAPGQCDADSTNVYGSPGLVLTGSKPVPFFRIAEGESPLVDSGSADADAPTSDFDGDARGTARDIGADELGGDSGGSGGSTGTEPAGVTGLTRTDTRPPN